MMSENDERPMFMKIRSSEDLKALAESKDNEAV